MFFTSVAAFFKRVWEWLKLHPRFDIWLIGIALGLALAWGFRHPHVVTVTEKTEHTTVETKTVVDTKAQEQLTEAQKTIETLKIQLTETQKKVQELSRKTRTTTDSTKFPDGRLVTHTVTETLTDSKTTTDTDKTKTEDKTKTDDKTKSDTKTDETKTTTDTKTDTTKTDKTTTTTGSDSGHRWNFGIQYGAEVVTAMPTAKFTQYLYGDISYTLIPRIPFIGAAVETTLWGTLPFNDPSHPVVGIGAGLRFFP